ncbi:hypothetical protein JMUB7557_27750 [Staphylococcus aureus]
MCNDTLELLRIKDENIKYINQEIDVIIKGKKATVVNACLLYTSPSPRDTERSRMPSSA